MKSRPMRLKDMESSAPLETFERGFSFFYKNAPTVQMTMEKITIALMIVQTILCRLRRLLSNIGN